MYALRMCSRSWRAFLRVETFGRVLGNEERTGTGTGTDTGTVMMANSQGSLLVCPHCWNVNMYALRLCGRCGADMSTALQESGGLRWTAAVQSPVPQPG